MHLKGKAYYNSNILHFCPHRLFQIYCHKRRTYSHNNEPSLTGSSSSSPIFLDNLFSLSREAAKNDPTQKEKLFIGNANFLQREIRVRLGQRVQSFQSLPFIVGCHGNIQRLMKLYRESYEKSRKLEQIPIESIDQALRYSGELEALVDQHSDVLDLLSGAVKESMVRYMSKSDLVQFVEEMVRARIGIRILAEHHLALLKEPHFGIIHNHVEPAKIMGSLIPFVQNLSEQQYGCSVPILLDGRIDASFCFIPAHLDYILFELLKNAMRSTVQMHRSSGNSGSVNIRVTVAQSDDDLGVVLRIRDQGGGIPAHSLHRVFDYSFTTTAEDAGATAQPANRNSFSLMDMEDVEVVQKQTGGAMAGFGFGLPVARLYTEYFGGQIRLVSMEGYGCDLFIKLNNLTPNLSHSPI